MATYTDHGKTSSAERNSGRKPKLSERNRRALKRAVSKHYRTAAANVAAQLSTRLEDLHPQIVRRELHKSNIHGRSAIAKPPITENNTKRRKGWRDVDKTWTSDDWKYVKWSDELSCTLFPTSGRTPKEACNPECLVPTVKHGGGSVMIWAAISWCSAGLISTLNGRTTWTF